MATAGKHVIVEEQSTNGVIAMPIKTAIIELDEIGYTGWQVKVRTNPRADMWDQFLSAENESIWDEFKKFIIKWNFADESGKALELESTRRGDLPTEIPNFLLNKYIELFNEVVGFPKVPNTNSEPTS